MSLDKKIQKTFNPPPSLEGEDWLMPSDDLFNSIEEAIYDEPKKKKRGFWLWLLFMLIVGFIAAYYVTTYDADDKQRVAHTSAIINNNVNENPLVSNPVQTQSAEYEINELVVDEMSNDIQQPIKNVDAQNTSSMANASVNVNHQILEKNNSRFWGVEKKSILENELLLISALYAEQNTKQDLTLHSIQIQSQTHEGSYNRVANLLGHRINEIEYITDVPINRSSKIVPFTILPEEHILWSLRLYSGLSNWNFDLNNNYLTALEPADFNFTDGQGFFVELGVERRLSNCISIGVYGSIDRITFESGHNSSINYILDIENDNHTEGFDLTMASPIGFLQSNIVVARSVDADSHTPLTIDLNNVHTITNADLGMYADIKLLGYNRFNLSTQLGGGLNYLTKITNTLNSFNTSEAGFDSHSSKILSDQSDIQKLRTYYNLGFNLDYSWSKTTSIGASYQLRQDLNAIYNSGDFSTLVKRQYSGIYIRVII